MTRRLALAAFALAAVACKTPDPKQLLAVENVETYWAIDQVRGTERYLAPVVRFEIKNTTGAGVSTIQAQAIFRLKGKEQETWGSDWRQVTPAARPLPPGTSVLAVMKNEARYHSPVEPELFFQHAQFQDVLVEIYLKVGSSPWTKMVTAPIERKIGSKAVTGANAPAKETVILPSPKPSPTPSAAVPSSPLASAPPAR